MPLMPRLDELEVDEPRGGQDALGQDFGSRVELALAASNHLLNARNSPRYVAQVLQGVTAVATKLERTTRPFTGVGPSELKARVAAVDLETPLPDTAAALQELEDVYLRDAVYFHDAKYAGHLNCPVVIPALVGEAVLSAVNSSLDTWDQSAGATMIERRLIDWAAARLNLGDAADGIFTSGAQPVQSPGPADRPQPRRDRPPPGTGALGTSVAGPAGYAADLHLRRQPLQHPKIGINARAGIRRRCHRPLHG
ncbi:hypothetical protein QF047_003732 [Arthrobacter sp. W4I7]|nr:hypothetical protein [Arthrobacter sp. W4I7]